MNILDLFARIGLKADTGPANNFLKSVNGIKSGLIGAVSGTLSLAAAVKAVNGAFTDTLGMKKFADDTGASVQEMQKWKQVADQVNGSGEGVAASIRAITQNQEKIKLGQGNISGYQLLGIDPRSDPFKVLEALRTKTQGMSQGMRRNIAAQFGVSNDLVATLELTNAEFDKMAGNAYVVSPESIAGVNRARASVTELMNRLNYMRTESIAKLAPLIKKGVEWLHRIITAGQRILTMIDSFVRGSIGWRNAIMGIVGAFIALNSAVMLPVAGFLLLFAILEDLYVYSKGGESVFGELVKSFPALKGLFDGMVESINILSGALQGLMTGDWANFDRLVEKWGLFGSYLLLAKDSILGIKEAIGMVTADTEEKRAGHETKLRKTNVTLLDTFERAITGLLGDKVGGAVLGVAGTGMLKDMMKPKAATVPATAGSTTVTNNFTISGTSDPAAVGAEIEYRLADTYKNARTPYQNPKAER